MQSSTDILYVKHAVRHRDGFACVECGVTEAEYRQQTGRRLDVHRLTPGADYAVEGCQTLCRACHGPKPRQRWGRDRNRRRWTVMIPGRWYKVLQQLARERRQPVSWLIISIIHDDMIAKGYAAPEQLSPPWENQ